MQLFSSEHMRNIEFTAPSKQQATCQSVNNFLDSNHFASFLVIWNRSFVENTTSKNPVTIEDVLNDADLRNRMRAFYKDILTIKIMGAAEAKTLELISVMINKVIELLNDRNDKLSKEEFENGDFQDQRLRNSSIA